jgi:hypothetical protein
MFRRLQSLNQRSRRLVAVASLVGFLATASGVPVFNARVGPNGKDISQPFPCMHSRCGCQNAESCWRGCCCHTNAEKLAWAEENGVTPPEYVHIAAAKERPAAIAKTDSCCSEKQEARGDNCCSSTGRCEADLAENGIAQANDDWQWTLVPTVSARKCQGLAQLWLLIGSAAPAVRSVEVTVRLLPAGTLCLADEFSANTLPRPTTPPPRV